MIIKMTDKFSKFSLKMLPSLHGTSKQVTIANCNYNN